ncbi:MAG: MATE family efflux transporter [Clostridia bacterium]|nr:MATE family efflux transporter [Clostridia bacterium]
MKKYELDMSRGSIIKNIMLFSIPLMLSSILQLLFNAADVVIVGKFDGELALAAVGSTTSLINLIINVFMGYATGAAVVISRHFGANDERATHRAVNSCITMSLIFGVFLLFVGVVFGKTFLELMSCPPDVIDSAAVYLRIYFLGMPAFMLYNFGSGVLRAVGDTRRPLYYLSVAGVVNVVLNLFFVIKLGWGVAGVATATTISQCISAFLVIRCLIVSKQSYRLNVKALRIDKKEFMFMTKIGLPAGIQGSLFSIANVTIQSLINSFGSAAVAGNATASNIEGFVFVIVNCIAQAVLTFTGQNMGAGKISRIKKGVFTGLGLQAVIVLSVAIIVNIFAYHLSSLYADEPEVIQLAVNRLRIISVTYFICGFNEVFVAALRGLGTSTLPMITSIFGICGLRLVYIATVFKVFNSLESLYLTYPISWIITGAVNGILLVVLWKKLTGSRQI